MKPERLAAIKARYEAASPAEDWLKNAYIDDDPEDINIAFGKVDYFGTCPNVNTQKQAEDDTVFAAHARTDTPNLVAEIERLKKLVKSAHREGVMGLTDDEARQVWSNSESRKALEQE